MAMVVEVGKERARRVVEQSQAGRFGNVFKRSVAAISVEPVGQPRRLTNVQIVEAVVVDIGNRNPVMAVNVDPRSAVEYSAPVVGAVQHLVGVGRVAAEGHSRDISVEGRIGTSLRFVENSPASKVELVGPE